MSKASRLAMANALIAGGLVFAGAFTDGSITSTGIISAISASVIIFLTKMREYLEYSKMKRTIKGNIFEFI